MSSHKYSEELQSPPSPNKPKRSRSKRACTKCQARKTRCSGDKPCRYCLSLNKPNECVFIIKEKPKLVTVQESFINSLKMRISELEQKFEEIPQDVVVPNINKTNNNNNVKPNSNRRMSLTHIVIKEDKPTKSLESNENSENNNLKAKNKKMKTDLSMLNNNINDYVLENELSMKNMLVDSNVTYSTSFNIFLGNANCTKYNLTIQSILTDNLNSLIDKQNRNCQVKEKIPKFPAPVLPTVFYKSGNLHWNNKLKTNLENLILPTQDFANQMISLLFESLGHDLLVVNRYEVSLTVIKIYNEFELCTKIEIIQFLTLVAMGESLIAAKEDHQQDYKESFPGIKYFSQAVQLFEDIFEECSIPYVETCLLFCIYSLALNRKDSAYIYTGLAIRLAYTLGLHRKVINHEGFDEIILEKRRRLWWSCYIWDRIVTARLGHPVMIDDESMDIELPSNQKFVKNQDFEGLRYFPKHPGYLIEQIKLARISGLILTKIYSINKTGKFKDSFIVSVHSILNLLRSWYNDLNNFTNNNGLLKKSKSSLRLDYSSLDGDFKRQTYSLHLNYNYCIILTTRPLLLYVFKQVLQGVDSEYSPTTLGILKSCVNASLINLKISQILLLQDRLALFALMDNNYIFSAVLMLVLIDFIKNYNSQGFNLFTKIFYKQIFKKKVGATNNNSNKNNSLNQKELTSKINFSLNLLKTGSEVGSACAKVYYLQLTGLLTLLEKISRIKDKKDDFMLIKKITDEGMIYTNLFQRLNQMVRSSDKFTTVDIINHATKDNDPETSSNGSSLNSNHANDKKSLKQLALGAMGVNTKKKKQNVKTPDSSISIEPLGMSQSIFGLPSNNNNSNNNLLDCYPFQTAVDFNNNINSNTNETSPSSLSPSISNLEQEYFNNDAFNLLDDEMVSNFLNYNGWQQVASPNDKLFEIFNQNDNKKNVSELINFGINNEAPPLTPSIISNNNNDELLFKSKKRNLDNIKEEEKEISNNDIGFYNDIMNVFTIPQNKK